MFGSIKYGIYIPIWLDLLYMGDAGAAFGSTNLHSNMVRFIIIR